VSKTQPGLVLISTSKNAYFKSRPHKEWSFKIFFIKQEKPINKPATHSAKKKISSNLPNSNSSKTKS